MSLAAAGESSLVLAGPGAPEVLEVRADPVVRAARDVRAGAITTVRAVRSYRR